eukprot:GHVT01102278.1.p1 GENE.GHVT01102278.1~~GHVT01102278.1.p1  ORF type:complete len:451 (+),score=94.38 GHVT01102278.1:1342-2694(+)
MDFGSDDGPGASVELWSYRFGTCVRCPPVGALHDDDTPRLFCTAAMEEDEKEEGRALRRAQHLRHQALVSEMTRVLLLCGDPPMCRSPICESTANSPALLQSPAAAASRHSSTDARHCAVPSASACGVPLLPAARRHGGGCSLQGGAVYRSSSSREPLERHPRRASRTGTEEGSIQNALVPASATASPLRTIGNAELQLRSGSPGSQSRPQTGVLQNPGHGREAAHARRLSARARRRWRRCSSPEDDSLCLTEIPTEEWQTGNAKAISPSNELQSPHGETLSGSTTIASSPCLSPISTFDPWPLAKGPVLPPRDSSARWSLQGAEIRGADSPAPRKGRSSDSLGETRDAATAAATAPENNRLPASDPLNQPCIDPADALQLTILSEFEGETTHLLLTPMASEEETDSEAEDSRNHHKLINRTTPRIPERNAVTQHYFTDSSWSSQESIED